MTACISAAMLTAGGGAAAAAAAAALAVAAALGSGFAGALAPEGVPGLPAGGVRAEQEGCRK